MSTTTDTPTTAATALPWAELRVALVDFVARRVESRDAAEDIVQDVLERAQRADFTAIANPQAWLYRAARNAVVDHYRARRPEAPLPADLDASLEPIEADEGPNEATRELARCMRPLIERLPADYRRALTLVDLDGLTHAEAAAREQITVSGMKSRVQRGRARLGALLNECCVVATTSTGAVSSYTRRDPGCC